MISDKLKLSSIQILMEILYSKNQEQFLFFKLCIVFLVFESEREAKATCLSEPSGIVWETAVPIYICHIRKHPQLGSVARPGHNVLYSTLTFVISSLHLLNAVSHYLVHCHHLFLC